VWGAFLSTLLALLKLAHPRPIVTIAMVRPRALAPELEMIVANPAKYPVMIRNIRSFGAPVHWQSGSIKDWDTIDVVKHALYKRLNIPLMPNESARFIAMFVNELKDQNLTLVISYTSHRFVAWPMFPTIVYRSAKDLFELSQHPRPIELQSDR
jgi:hypothetical protein